MEFNYKQFLEDNIDKTPIQRIDLLNVLLESVKKEKMSFVNQKDFESAANMRDIERKLIDMRIDEISKIK